MKIYVVGGNIRYANWINAHTITGNIKEAELVLFTGGSDVDPCMYGFEKNSKTFSNYERDLDEEIVMEIAIINSIPMLGICRGSQLLTALQSGGYLIQHVNNHALYGTHSIEFSTGEVFDITSTHHQMMYPFDVKNYELLAWATPKRSDIYELSDNNTIKVEKEPEVVFYPDTKCLCVQGHPESMNINSPIIKKLNELIKIKLFK